MEYDTSIVNSDTKVVGARPKLMRRELMSKGKTLRIGGGNRRWKEKVWYYIFVDKNRFGFIINKKPFHNSNNSNTIKMLFYIFIL